MTAAAVRAEQIRTLYRQSPWMAALSPINAAIVGAVLWSPARAALIIGWVAASALVAVARVLLRARYLRQAASVQGAELEWGRLYAGVMALSGLMWGLGSLLLYDPRAQLDNLVLVFVVGGMAAGAAGTMAYYLPVFFSFVIPTILPLSIRILLEGDRLHVAMGTLGMLFGAALAVIATNTQRAVVEAFRLRFANEHLLARLSRAQVSLEEANRTLEQRVEERTTELKHQSEALEEARRMESLGLLVGGVAHDFNNLLTVILGNATMLLDRPAVVAEGREAVGQIEEAAQRAGWLVSQLLASSRHQVRKARIIDVNAIVSATHKLLSRLIGEHVELVVALHAGPLPVEADAGQVEQVIINLATNARDAMPSGGRLTIETRSEVIEPGGSAVAPGMSSGNYALLSVRDTGVGMDAETRRMAFHPFFTTKEVGHGTGLGLATVNGIVAQSGGRVFVESEPGKGSCFSVYLPRVEGAVAFDVAAAFPIVAAHRGAVLLVEDEPMVRAVASQALAGVGMTVIEAENGDEALERARAHDGPIDLVLTDVVMARMGGPELAIRLRAERPEVRILFVSGYSREARIPPVDVAAGIDFLEKPFTPKILVERVARLLAAGSHPPSDEGVTPDPSEPGAPRIRQS